MMGILPECHRPRGITACCSNVVALACSPSFVRIHTSSLLLWCSLGFSRCMLATCANAHVYATWIGDTCLPNLATHANSNLQCWVPTLDLIELLVISSLLIAISSLAAAESCFTSARGHICCYDINIERSTSDYCDCCASYNSTLPCHGMLLRITLIWKYVTTIL